jgi:hypothetical protein
MYSPHQIPWTIEGTEKLLKIVYKQSGYPFYITLDTGHQVGQWKFLLPSPEEVRQRIKLAREGKRSNGLWLGSKNAYELYEAALNAPADAVDGYVKKIESDMAFYPYLFARQEDSDVYNWLERLACYSPIIHMQQTDGKSSLHSPFTEECNQDGIISAEKVLRAIKASYKAETRKDMPPKVEDIYLTLEIFSPTADINMDIQQCRLPTRFSGQTIHPF